MKRVVTGHNEEGKSVFVKISEPEHVVNIPGMLWKELWATHPGCKVPVDTSIEPTRNEKWKVFPGPGGTTLRVIDFDPGQEADPASLTNSDIMDKELPGLSESAEPDAPGMHTTDTVDYGVVLAGRLALELDDGESVDLEPGDVVIQNGTRHAWRIKEKCTVLWVIVGAERL